MEDIKKIKNRIADIEKEIFFLEMKDHLDNTDWDYKRELDSEKATLKAKLKELEKC